MGVSGRSMKMVAWIDEGTGRYRKMVASIDRGKGVDEDGGMDSVRVGRSKKMVV